MSSYAPPTENVAIFDEINFRSGETTLTQSMADKRYLRYPNAQGTETLQDINVNGVATFSNIVTAPLDSDLTIESRGTGDIIFKTGNTTQFTINEIGDGIFNAATNFLQNSVWDTASIEVNDGNINVIDTGVPNQTISLQPDTCRILFNSPPNLFQIDATGIMSNTTTTNALHYLNFSSSAVDNAIGKILKTSSLTYNPNTNAFNVSTNLKVPGTGGTGSLSFGIGSGTTQGNNSLALGSSSGVSQGNNGVAIGTSAGVSQGNAAIAIGNQAGQSSLLQSISIGLQAGQTSQQTQAIAIGTTSGQTSQAANSIAIGLQAGQTSQSTNSVAIGYQCGTTNQSASAVSIGSGCGNNAQGSGSVAIGINSGNSNQSTNSVAIGNESGYVSQGISCVAVGINSGRNSQSDNSVAIGSLTGQLNQGASSVAVGFNAGNLNQGTGCVALGVYAGAGQVTGMGNNSIAIGNSAGISSQVANSICLNASGTNLNPAVAGFHVNPIRNVTQTNLLGYDISTREVTYYSGAPTAAITDTNDGTTYYPTFVNAAGTNQTLRADIATGPLSYVPSTSTLTSTIFSGNPFLPNYFAGGSYNWTPGTGVLQGLNLNSNKSFQSYAVNITGTTNTITSIILFQPVMPGFYNFVITNSGSGDLTINVMSPCTWSVPIVVATTKNILINANYLRDGTGAIRTFLVSNIFP
jgi:hypothetical protein